MLLVSFNSLANGSALKINIGLLIMASLIMMLMTKLRKLFSKSKKKVILYLLFILVSFALTGLLSSSRVLNDTPLNSFFGFQFVFLLLGILHIYILRKYFDDLSKDSTDFFSEFLFTISFLLVGLIAFYNVVGHFKQAFSMIFLTSGIVFILPLLIYKLFEFAMLIPIQIYDKWYFPVGEEIKEPTTKELENPLVISFEFQKEEKDPNLTHFRVKAPENMEFGKLFYFFISDYNERHPESTIEFIDQYNKSQAWFFYFKPRWWSSIKHIDFNKTISWNNIKENTVIICQRAEDV